MAQHQQPPAVVIIARHGPRLDAADQSWHLSTPTPYDPPLTYGGWNQCRSLGIRIASILHAREQSWNEERKEPLPDGVRSQDFALPEGQAANRNGAPESGTRKRKRKHKVVIHSSPFLRCLQSSVGIAAGMAQFQPSDEAGAKSSSVNKTRGSGQTPSASPQPRSPHLAPLLEPKRDLARTIARKSLHEHRRHRRAKLRVDAFLGEWLNPQYFDNITPPPQSQMMLAAAKAELLHSENIDIFTPTVSPKTAMSSLWGSATNQKSAGQEEDLDEATSPEDTQATAGRRSRSNSVSSVGSNDSSSGRRSLFRPGRALQPAVSTVPKPEVSIYVPPKPQYAVSGSDHIPRGYVTHARQACTSVDYQWDSSRPPQDWGDGGEYGEEWSAMHKRFRKGLNHLVGWYSHHNADDRAEDALGLEQAEKHHEDEEEELVLILVTHGAGSNALIGALTGQPVLLDVGMASLTMAVRRDDAPPLTTPQSHLPDGHDSNESNDHPRKGSQLDLGLSSVYEMKLVSSSEHLRPGADPTKVPTFGGGRSGAEAQTTYRQRSEAWVPTIPAPFIDPDSNRGSTNSSLGSMRRPSLTSVSSAPPGPGGLLKSATLPTVPESSSIKITGLWTPPAVKTPQLVAQDGKEEHRGLLSSLNDSTGRVSPGRDLVLDFSTSPPDSRPTSSSGPGNKVETSEPKPAKAQEIPRSNALAMALNGTLDGAVEANNKSKATTELPLAGTSPPAAFGRSLSQRGLWGTAPGGAKVERRFPIESKRRWTVNQNDTAAH